MAEDGLKDVIVELYPNGIPKQERKPVLSFTIDEYADFHQELCKNPGVFARFSSPSMLEEYLHVEEGDAVFELFHFGAPGEVRRPVIVFTEDEYTTLYEEFKSRPNILSIFRCPGLLKNYLRLDEQEREYFAEFQAHPGASRYLSVGEALDFISPAHAINYLVPKSRKVANLARHVRFVNQALKFFDHYLKTESYKERRFDENYIATDDVINNHQDELGFREGRNFLAALKRHTWTGGMRGIVKMASLVDTRVSECYNASPNDINVYEIKR